MVWYNQQMQYQRDEHRIHLIAYHIVFCPKRRKAVLTGSIATDCAMLIREKCEEHGWRIAALAVMPDHVHLFVRVWPTTAAAEVVREVKGRTSHDLREKYPLLRRLPSLWTRSYFASTTEPTADDIQAFITAQSRT